MNPMWLIRAIGMLCILICAQSAVGDDYPSKPIRMVIPWPAGGIADLRGRVLAERLSKPLGQQVIVDNRPGADGSIGAYAVAQARPDGYTILYGSNIDQVIAPAVNPALPYVPLRDLIPVIVFGKSHLLLVVNPAVPAKDMKQFAEWLKNSREPPAYSSGGNAHMAHLSGVMIEDRLRVKLLHIPYKGAAPALLAVIGGDVSFGFDFVATSLPMIEAGKLRALVVMGPKRLRSLPTVPSVDEVGMPDMYAYTWGGVFLPKGTPQPVAIRLQSELQRIAASADIRDHSAFSGMDFEVKTGSDLIEFIRAEQTKWGNLVKVAGVKVE